MLRFLFVNSGKKIPDMNLKKNSGKKRRKNCNVLCDVKARSAVFSAVFTAGFEKNTKNKSS